MNWQSLCLIVFGVYAVTFAVIATLVLFLSVEDDELNTEDAPPKLRQRFHGTVGGYQRHRCRCEPCVTAMRRYWRDKSVAVDFSASCWCEAAIVPVTPEMVKAGLTGSCGRPGCQAS